MRRLGVLVLVGALALAFVGSPASRAATIASSWPVGPQPFGLALDDSTGKVYVANSGNSLRVSVVDPATGSVGTIATTQIPNIVLTDSANRRLYSSNYNFSTMQRSLDVFDLDSAARLATLPVGGFGMALDRTTGRLYVCESGSLKVIDTTTFTVVASAPAPFNTFWWAVAVDPDRHHLYVTNIRETSPTFFVLDDRDLAVLAEIPLATASRFAVTVDPVTHYALVAGGQRDPQTFQLNSSFSVIDPDSLTVVHAISMPGFAVGIALAPSRHRIYVSDESGWRLYGIDDRTFDIAETINQDSFVPGLLLMHPDGRLYAGNYNSSANANSTLVALDLDNHAPVFQSLALTPSPASTGDTLHVQGVAFDPDLKRYSAPDPTMYTYEWSRNGTVLSATGPTLDLSVAGNGDRGDTISVRVTASDGQLSSVASTSIVIGDSAPTAAVSLSNTAPATNAVLTARASAIDADNDAMTYRFIWRVNGVVRQTTLAGANASDNFDLGIAGNGDHGDGVAVELVASDGTLESGAASASATIVNSAPTVAVSLNTTAPTSRSVLIATVLGQDIDSDGLTYVYTWRLNGVVKRTVTTTSTTDRYDLSVRGNGDKGDTVTVAVTATDGSLTSPSASVSATVRSH